MPLQGTRNDWSGRFDRPAANDNVVQRECGVTPEPPPAILVVCADATLGQEYYREIERRDPPWPLRLARSGFEAGRGGGDTWAVIVLDASSLPELSGASLQSAVGLFLQAAPVVIVAEAHLRSGLAVALASGRVEFVARTGNFVAAAADLVERRTGRSSTGGEFASFTEEELNDFGEILRHEVNNPLTGILGNAELLLARRENLSPGAIERLKTIAELAVRLRETVRRLSRAWGERHEHVRSA